MLFDYQREMLERIGHALDVHPSVMVQMPTGTGKTVLLAAVVEKFLHGSRVGEVWVVAHRRELITQIARLVRHFFPSEDMARIRVTSIQWLTRHYQEMGLEPGLIVIDEAHHALAETYAAVMNAFPQAAKLGLTATPCRMDGRGLAGLFDVLLTSWSMERFIVEGRLSAYDYYSIKPDSPDQRLIDSLGRRGADGDYLQSELSERLDVRPTIERLCRTVCQYVPGRKGIVYAISIRHAEHIAHFYRVHGIRAVAISSRTPDRQRRELLARFGSPAHQQVPGMERVDVLVSVDLFSEGFDCPDVEFVQLARPTLSLSKYLQMVGRGLRVARGKEYCVVLDNVGLYKRFGLPSASRDWQSLFLGRSARMTVLQEACLRLYKELHLKTPKSSV